MRLQLQQFYQGEKPMRESGEGVQGAASVTQHDSGLIPVKEKGNVGWMCSKLQGSLKKVQEDQRGPLVNSHLSEESSVSKKWVNIPNIL